MQDFKIIRSKRRTLAMTIDDNLQVVVKAPYCLPKQTIHRFVEKNQEWIAVHTEKKRAYQAAHPPCSEEEICILRQQAKEILPQRVAYYSRLMGVSPTGIKITAAKKRFGSCNGKNSICFSLYLMQYPQEAIDYVVVHELAHIRYHNHSKEFYRFVASVLPDYKEREKLLKQ